MILSGRTRKLFPCLTCGRGSCNFVKSFKTSCLLWFLNNGLSAFGELKVVKPGKRKAKCNTQNFSYSWEILKVHRTQRSRGMVMMTIWVAFSKELMCFMFFYALFFSNRFRFTGNWSDSTESFHISHHSQHSFPCYSHFVSVQYICYNWRTNIDVLLLTKSIVYIKTHFLCCTLFGFDKCVVTSLHHYSIIQNNFTALKSPILLKPLGPWQALIFLLSL